MAAQSFLAPSVREECVRRLTHVLEAAIKADRFHATILVFEEFLQNCSSRLGITPPSSPTFTIRALLNKEWHEEMLNRLQALNSRRESLVDELTTNITVRKRHELLTKKKTLEVQQATLLAALEKGVADQRLRQFAKRKKFLSLPNSKLMRIDEGLNLDEVIAHDTRDGLRQYWDDLFERFACPDPQDSEDGSDSSVDFVFPIPFTAASATSKLIECRVPCEIGLTGEGLKGTRFAELDYSFGPSPIFSLESFLPAKLLPGTGDFGFKVSFGNGDCRFVQLRATDEKRRTIISPVFFMHQSGFKIQVTEHAGTPEEVLQRCRSEMERALRRRSVGTVSKTVSKRVGRSSREHDQAMEK